MISIDEIKDLEGFYSDLIGAYGIKTQIEQVEKLYEVINELQKDCYGQAAIKSLSSAETLANMIDKLELSEDIRELVHAIIVKRKIKDVFQRFGVDFPDEWRSWLL